MATKTKATKTKGDAVTTVDLKALHKRMHGAAIPKVRKKPRNLQVPLEKSDGKN